MKKALIFDIETTYNKELLDLAVDKADPEVSREEIKQEMALNPLWGRIVAIGVMSEDKRGERVKIMVGEEDEILRDFWKLCRQFQRFVGYNSIQFDVPYLELRSRLLQVEIPITISQVRYRKTNHIDLYMVLTNWSGNRSKYLKFNLDTVAEVLDVNYLVGESHLVPTWFEEGNIDLIEEHLSGDLKTTKALYDKLYGYD